MPSLNEMLIMPLSSIGGALVSSSLSVPYLQGSSGLENLLSNIPLGHFELIEGGRVSRPEPPTISH